MSNQVQERLAKDFGQDSLFHTTIPINVAIARAADHYKPVLLTEPKSTGAIAFQRLAKEFIYRYQQQQQQQQQ